MDLDDELFAATAGAKPSNKKRKSSKSTKGSNSKRRRELSESDESEGEAELSEEEVSEGDDDDDDDDDEDALLRGKKDASKGGSSMPLKKRVAMQDDDSDEASVLDDEDLFERELYKELGFGKDLYKDDEDKNELAQMTEFYREYELAERAEKRDALIEQHQLRERNRQQEAAFVESTQTPKARQSAGPKRTQPQRRQEREKDSELKELKAIREKKGLHKPRPTARPSRDDDEEGSSGEEYQEEDAKPSDNEEDLEEEDDDDYAMVDRRGDDRRGRREETPEAYSDDDMEDMHEHDEEKFAEQSDLKHVILSRVTLEKWHKELFFANTVVGCFVKVSVGVKDGHPIYALGEVVDIIDGEHNGKQLKHYEFPLGLTQAMEIAKEEGNEDEVGDIEAQLMDVEEKLLNSNEALARIGKLNKSNAHQNLVFGSEAGGKKTDKKSKDKMQESKVDPFSRRATSFSCYWTPRTTQEDAKAKAEEEAAPAAPQVDEKQTSKWLLLVCGTKKAFSMDMVSNKEMTEQDFLTMQKYISRYNLSPPTKGQVERVSNKIRDAENFRYSSEAVNQIVAQRKASGKAPINPSVEKD
eukprot:gene17271-20551_t